MGTQFARYHNEKVRGGLYGWRSPFAIHAGEFLEDALRECGMRQSDLAERIGLSTKSINDILRGRSPVTHSTAFKLGKVFHFPPEYWMELQQSYEDTKARLEENAKLAEEVKKHTPNFQETYQELKKLGLGFVSGLRWDKKNLGKITLELQRFFAVGSLGFVDDTMEFAFRKYKRGNVNPYTLSAWLRIGKIKAQETDVPPFNEKKLKNLLPELKKLSNKKSVEYLLEVERLLADCGVVIVYMPKMKNTFVQGASAWITSNKALLMLNTHKRNEGQFWFNLFHEIGHILYHSKKEPFVDFDEDSKKSEKEQEADRFAQRNLIARFEETMEYFKERVPRVGFRVAIKNAAKREGVSASVFAGRLTYEYRENERVYRDLSEFLPHDITHSNLRDTTRC